MTVEDAPDSGLVPVFMPSLGATLLHAEKLKGTPLTEPQVLAIRDGSACVLLPADQAQAMDESRGYSDLDPTNVWEAFLALKRALTNVPRDPTHPESHP